MELHKSNAQLNQSLNFGKSVEILDDILSHQRSPFIKWVFYTRNVIRPFRKNQAQSLKKRKMKKIPKVMLIFSRAPSTMNVAREKEMNFIVDVIF